MKATVVLIKGQDIYIDIEHKNTTNMPTKPLQAYRDEHGDLELTEDSYEVMRSVVNRVFQVADVGIVEEMSDEILEQVDGIF